MAGCRSRSWRPVLFGRRVAVPTVRRIIVGVHGSLGSLQALRFAADEARQRDVPLLAVTAWVPPGGDLAERRNSSPYLRKIWREAAWERLWAAFDAGLGGVPADVRVESQAVRGETGPVLAVPPSALMDEMSRPLHSWHVRRHELIPDTPDM